MNKQTIYGADLYCGAGGSSSGLFLAGKDLKQKIKLLAVNHSPVAIATHSANHKTTKHLCEEISRKLDPLKVVPGGKLDILIASPECIFHSIARGGAPVNTTTGSQSRASPKHVIRWARDLKPEVIIVENVREWQFWGPLGTNGKPLKRRRGEFFKAWVRGLERMGYRVEWRILNAADYGDATARQRLFVLARAGRRPITWPEPTHFPKANLLGMKQWRPAREIIDWSIPGKSIFARKKPLAPATLERIAAGLRKLGGANAEPFLVILRNHMGTVVSKQSMALIEPFVLGQQSGSKARSTDKPIPTISTGGAIGLVEPFVTKFYGTAKNGQPVTEPLDTITSKDRFGLVQPDAAGGLILDIRFRMLQPSELAAAMSFPKGYKFTGTREQKVRQIGNAVCVRIAKALCKSALQMIAEAR